MTDSTLPSSTTTTTSPTTTVTTVMTATSDFECNVCMELVREPVVTHCGHLFCWSCLRRWLDIKSLCPVCKTHLRRTHITPVYGWGRSAAAAGGSSPVMTASVAAEDDGEGDGDAGVERRQLSHRRRVRLDSGDEDARPRPPLETEREVERAAAAASRAAVSAAAEGRVAFAHGEAATLSDLDVYPSLYALQFVRGGMRCDAATKDDADLVHVGHSWASVCRCW
jgi:hypothetical protein